MQLEGYFDFLPNGAIRLKGHRIGIDYTVEQYQDEWAIGWIGCRSGLSGRDARGLETKANAF